MSNHNLFIHGANGVAVSATSEQILAAARQVLARRVRRGAPLKSPSGVYEYLTMKLGALDYEVFGLVLADQRHRVIECVELFRGTISGASVFPREIVKLVLEKRAAAVVMFHNHPLCCFGNCHPLKSRVELQGLPAQRTMTRRARRQGNPRWRGRAAARSLTACAAACVVNRAGNVA